MGIPDGEDIMEFVKDMGAPADGDDLTDSEAVELVTTDQAIRAQLAHWRAMADDASPAPWLTDVFREPGEATWYLHITTKNHRPMEHGRIQNEKNERFAAMARDALPLLLDALEAMWESGEAMRHAAMRSGIIQANNAVPPDERMVEVTDIELIESTTDLFGAMDRWQSSLAAIAQALGTEGQADDHD